MLNPKERELRFQISGFHTNKIRKYYESKGLGRFYFARVGIHGNFSCELTASCQAIASLSQTE
jgi:hypothetical protein